MPVTDIVADETNLTLTVTADFPHPVHRVWQAYADPRQLERFWGPPTYPATFTEWDHRVGGRALYHMTGPRGDRSYARWDFLEIDPERRFEVTDSFADEHGTPVPGMPAMRMTFVFEPTEEGTRMTCTSVLGSLEGLRKVIEMGVIEGTRLAMGQIDAVLAGLPQWFRGQGTRLELLTDTLVRITRAVDVPRGLVWRAHNDPELMTQWMLGPDGWSMTTCQVATEVGQGYRFGWTPGPGVEGQPFGFEGELLLSDEPLRAVTSERMTGTDGPTTVNDLTLAEEDGVTVITTLIEYPDAVTRDMILGTGMVDGMEACYARMETLLAAT
ncbi:MAG: SRPBCC domain-containing protein [Acidipropionibacterium jensenii]|nr:SRPBCC domain-containing protein [Acidipropionibacterium jensenii]